MVTYWSDVMFSPVVLTRRPALLFSLFNWHSICHNLYYIVRLYRLRASFFIAYVLVNVRVLSYQLFLNSLFSIHSFLLDCK
jgi:hypothetical protein